ncbi:hypothetical protein HMPREF0620_1048 [Parascardovia denticolens DSM 10105 = JCM 12538]|uniref:Uncharacterized protein n=1 Tax=Parascardovia denticolens DSM 10105 = JCM 12538 TaxID=864564 RepID=E6JZJ7_PARDN|nr:hypothetical protein HMPREF0620_1048 [Parascardovia denticolens DSM 10105 = JCM 12538]
MTVQQPFDGRIELDLSLILSSDAYVSEWFPRLGFHMSESVIPSFLPRKIQKKPTGFTVPSYGLGTSHAGKGP